MIQITTRLAKALSTLILLAAASYTPQSHAQSYPTHTVTIIVPTAPGGSMDTTARIIADKLSAKWGKPVIVENRAGAAMRIGATAVAKAPPDGYTILLAHDGTMAMNAVVYQNLAYDPQKDFEPLALVATVAEVVIVNVKVPATTLEELLRLARAEPGKLNHSSGGTATLLSLEYLKSAAGVDIRDVPYKGGAPAVAAVIAGDTDISIADMATARAAFGSDRVRLLAVTSLRRQKFAPKLPTVDESGAPGFHEVNTWLGMFASHPHAARRADQNRNPRPGDHRHARRARQARRFRHGSARRVGGGDAQAAGYRHRQMERAGEKGGDQGGAVIVPREPDRGRCLGQSWSQSWQVWERFKVEPKRSASLHWFDALQGKARRLRLSIQSTCRA